MKDGGTGAPRVDSVGAFEAPTPLAWAALAAVTTGFAALWWMMLHQTLVAGFGDVQVFFRAGWAIWTGYPLYEVTDHHDWHYLYPPTLALLMGPFADPLPGFAKPTWSLSYPVALSVWYAINAGATIWATAAWASALGRHAALELRPTWLSAYWALRVLPPLALAGFLADDLVSGQTTTIVLVLTVLSLVALAERRPLRVALPLSLAIAIKMYPAALLLIPLLRRDVATLAWTTVLTCAWLFVLPALCIGVDATVALYQTFWIDRLTGFLRNAQGVPLRDELSAWSADMVSVGATLARGFAASAPDNLRPLPGWARRAQIGFDLLALAAIAAAGHRRFWRLRGPRPDAAYAGLIAGAILIGALPAMLPFAELHYWLLSTPLLAILLAEQWRRAGRASIGAGALLFAALANLAFHLTGAWRGQIGRIGLTTIVMLVPVILGLVLLWRQPTVAGGEASLVPAD